jgi:hypothetical protein
MSMLVTQTVVTHPLVSLFMTQRTNVLALLTATCLCLFSADASAQSAVVVNGEALSPQAVRALEMQYRTPLQPGRFWYDRASGLWGPEGGPSQGQIHPDLDLGGPLAADASVRSVRDKTFVFVNGRELHPQELTYLQKLFGAVTRARYWLNAQGIGGYEGGPPQFDLRAAAIAARSQKGEGYGHRGTFGNRGSDGECSYYNDPESGASVLTGNC